MPQLLSVIKPSDRKIAVNMQELSRKFSEFLYQYMHKAE